MLFEKVLANFVEILLNLFSVSEIDFTRDKINELPSSKISRFKSNISENTKSSNNTRRL